MSKHPFTVRLCVLLAVALPAAGCKSPFDGTPYLRSYELEQRLRQIEPMSPSGVSTAQQTLDEAEAAPVELPPPAELEMPIDEFRARVLRNNLDLNVVLLDPTIAKQAISEEEARFEALFFTDTSWNKTDTPTATTLSGSQTESLYNSVGVDLPLRTGGNLRFNVNASEFETDNAFSTLNPSYDADASVTISHNLLRGAGWRVNSYPIYIAEYQAQQVNAQTRLAVINVIANADRAYWRLQTARRLLEVRKAEHDLAVAQLEKARRMVEAGALPQVETVRAESGVAQTLSAIIAAEQRVRLEQRTIKRMINSDDLPMSGPTVIIPTTPVNPIHYEFERDQLVDLAMEGRMELLELEIQLAADALTVDYQKNLALPLVALDYTYNYNGLGDSYGSAFDMLGQRDFDDHRLGVRVEVPLGNEAARSRVNRAILNRLRSLATREQRRAQITEEVLDAVDQIETAWQQILAARQSSILAYRTYQSEQRQFELGLRTSTDVLQAQADYADAQATEVLALADYQIAQTDLMFATGTVLGAAQVRWEPIEPMDQISHVEQLKRSGSDTPQSVNKSADRNP